MIHRYWCGRCRKVSEHRSNDTPETTRGCPNQCGQLVTLLESVEEPTGAEADDPGDGRRKPPSRQEWYAAGYAAGTYERRFASPDFLPIWDDPDFTPTVQQQQMMIQKGTIDCVAEKYRKAEETAAPSQDEAL